jgi:hypothetical protein
MPAGLLATLPLPLFLTVSVNTSRLEVAEQVADKPPL